MYGVTEQPHIPASAKSPTSQISDITLTFINTYRCIVLVYVQILAVVRPSSPTDLNSETEQIRPVSNRRRGWRSFLLICKCLSKELRIVLDTTRRIKKNPKPFPFLLSRAVKILKATFFENDLSFLSSHKVVIHSFHILRCFLPAH